MAEIVGDRFELERLVGQGGMGAVYRALDRQTGAPVAVKLMLGGSKDDYARFAREIELLESLHNPAIVSYVAHGTTKDRTPYLVMEWLEGEDLSHALERGPIGVDSTIALARRAANALGSAHARGIVHRDIKPANLFLCGGKPDAVKIVDLGIARQAGGARATRTGAVIGTPEYMAPEQARGEADLDARADVFSLGCVLYQCLSGASPFTADHPVAALAKVLFEEPQAIEGAAPPWLARLVMRMLRKAKDERFADGTAVVTALGAQEAVEEVPLTSVAPHLTRSEQRMVSVVVALADARTDATITMGSDQLGTLRRVTEPIGAHVEGLNDGSFVATLSGHAHATDQVAAAARCAMHIRSALPDASLAVATGRARVTGGLPIGEVIDRATKIATDMQGGPPRVRVCEVTKNLLGSRFTVHDDGVLVGEADDENVRTVLGQSTPHVGRDRELGMLRALVDEAIAEPIARVALITAPAGLGKSRLRHEVVREIATRFGDQDDPPVVWVGRTDPARAGSPFGVVADALRRAFGIAGADDVARAALHERVSASGVADRDRVTAFLAEVLGMPMRIETLQAAVATQLRAAQADAILMADQSRRAFEELLDAHLSKHPVVLVLEDLHWADSASVKLIDAALRAHEERPFVVLAFARPEIRELFPKLWDERRLQEIRLEPLSRKAAERLARSVLGSQADVAKLIEQAGGNALYLEELLRAARTGTSGTLPDTVLAMVTSRLDALSADERRVLRAASVFGQVFPREGVTALVGNDSGGPLLAALEESEIVLRRTSSRFPECVDYTFRHALLRDAAYAMLVDEDRRLGHELAAKWLEARGEEAAALAEHYERGGNKTKAAAHYAQAGSRALRGNDYTGALAFAHKALASDPGDLALDLHLLCAEARHWSGDAVRTEAAAREALALAASGSVASFVAIGWLGSAVIERGDASGLERVAQLLRTPASPEASVARAVAVLRVCRSLVILQKNDLAGELLESIDRRDPMFAREPALRARLRSLDAAFAVHDVDTALVALADTAAAFEEAGDLRAALIRLCDTGSLLCSVGRYEDAARTLEGALQSAEKAHAHLAIWTAKHDLGLAYARTGRLAEGERLEREAIAGFRSGGRARMEGASSMYLGRILFGAGRIDEAEVELREAVRLLTTQPMLVGVAMADLARVLCAKGGGGDVAEALELARRARATGEVEEGEEIVWLAEIEALRATNALEPSRQTAAAAILRIEERVRQLRDPVSRAAFLHVPEVERTHHLSRE